MKNKIREVYIELIRLDDMICEYKNNYDFAYHTKQKINKIEKSVKTLINDIDNYRFF